MAKKEATQEIRIAKVRNNRKSIAIDWFQGDDFYSVTFHDNPLPSFTKALDALPAHVCGLCEFAAKDADKIVATGITVTEKGENSLALITAKKTIRKGKRVFNIATPLLAMYADEENKAADCMEKDEASAIEKVIKEAKKYVLGERAQGKLAFEETKENPPEADEKQVAFPPMTDPEKS